MLCRMGTSGNRLRVRPLVSAAVMGVLLGSRLCAITSAPTVLPPFLVEEKAVVKWHYGETPEFQVLSQCDDGQTRQIAERLHRLRQLLALVLPQELEHKTAIPATLLIYPEESLAEKAQAASSQFRRALPSWAERFSEDNSLTGDFHGSASFFDDERLCVLLSVPGAKSVSEETPWVGKVFVPGTSQPDYALGWTDLTPGYVSYLVANGQPPLPPWFSSGFLSLFQHISFADHEVRINPLKWKGAEVAATGRRLIDGTKKPAYLVHETPLELKPPELLPLRQIFETRRNPDVDVIIWLSESELFIRWAVTHSREAQLGDFVSRCRTEPVSEDLFRSCFKADYVTIENELISYIASPAFTKTVSVPVVRATKLGSFALRPASRLEISQIKGGFELLEAHTVLDSFPDVASQYLDEAERSLQHGYDGSPNNPQLAADLGVCKLEQGEPDAARPLLEQAVAAGVILPRPYIELARLRLLEEMNRVDALSAAQVAHILEPLRAAERLHVSLSAMFEIASEVWIHTSVPPAEADLAYLEEGVRLFPGSKDVPYKAVSALVAHGEGKRARALVSRGIDFAPNEEARDRLAGLDLAGSPHS
jgi:hypothetical protein